MLHLYKNHRVTTNQVRINSFLIALLFLAYFHSLLKSEVSRANGLIPWEQLPEDLDCEPLLDIWSYALINDGFGTVSMNISARTPLAYKVDIAPRTLYMKEELNCNEPEKCHNLCLPLIQDNSPKWDSCCFGENYPTYQQNQPAPNNLNIDNSKTVCWLESNHVRRGYDTLVTLTASPFMTVAYRLPVVPKATNLPAELKEEKFANILFDLANKFAFDMKLAAVYFNCQPKSLITQLPNPISKAEQETRITKPKLRHT